MKKPKWTSEEEHTLMRLMEEHQDNLTNGFREVAKILNRTPMACRARYGLLKSTEKNVVLIARAKRHYMYEDVSGYETINKKTESFWAKVKKWFNKVF